MAWLLWSEALQDVERSGAGAVDLDGASVCLIRYPGIGRGAGAILSREGVCLPCPGRRRRGRVRIPALDGFADRAALDDPALVRV